ncbi:7729_t:CDS:2 [Funneliformis caledonium]|uniref:7729_t:CDS:1 n=1 Tax=Funneliformis caledonium TaxID=1117310 RepID=A0A9N9I351_9GLOM|nr:7729_t:CDS:2 [Funneliformis caledonium]
MALPIQVKMKGKALVYDILKNIISASQAEKNILFEIQPFLNYGSSFRIRVLNFIRPEFAGSSST